MTENIAERIRHSQGLTWEDMPALARERHRLWLSLGVAGKWVETANKEDADTLASHAEYTRDKIEEEYSRVCFEMEVLRLRGNLGRMTKERDEKPPTRSEEQIRAGMVSDALIDAYVVVSESSFDERYQLMGALMVAHDALPEEIADPEQRG